MAAARPLDRQRWILTVALLALAVLWLAPIAWVVVTSLKPSENIVRLPPEWIPWPATGAHYLAIESNERIDAGIAEALARAALGQPVLVDVRIDGTRRVYSLRPDALAELDRWLDSYRRFWDARLNDLESHLDSRTGRERAEEPT